MMYMNAKMRSALFDPTCPKAGRSLGANVLIRLANCPMLTRVARELTFRLLNSKDVATGRRPRTAPLASFRHGCSTR